MGINEIVRNLTGSKRYTTTEWAQEAFDLLMVECENALPRSEKRERLVRFLLAAPKPVKRGSKNA